MNHLENPSEGNSGKGSSSQDSISDIEQLLGGMSLKKPSVELDSRLANLGKRVGKSRFANLCLIPAIGLACLLAGFLMGRYSHDIRKPDLVTARATTEMDAGPNEQRQGTPSQTDSSANSSSDSIASSTTDVNENALANSNVKLVDEGLFLLHGKIPVRRYAAMSEERIQVIDKETGKPVEIIVPVKKSFVTRVYGT